MSVTEQEMRRRLTQDQIRGRELDALYQTQDAELQRLLGLQREFLPRPGASSWEGRPLGPPSESGGVMQALASQIDAVRQQRASVGAERSAFIQQQRAAAQRVRDQARLRELGLIPAEAPAAPAPAAPAAQAAPAVSADAAPPAEGGGSGMPSWLLVNQPTPVEEEEAVTTKPPPTSVAETSTAAVPAASIGAPAYGSVVVQDRQGLPVPLQCTSGVCSPDIQAGHFYANAQQSGLASSGYSERDRYYDAAIRQMIGGGPQGVLATEAGDRAMAVQDLRQTPAYQERYRQNVIAADGNRQAALALTDASFVGAAAEGAPGLSLGLTEQDTTPAIDQALSQRAGTALALGDPRLANPLSSAAEASGYYGGGSGALLYGTPEGDPAVLTQSGAQLVRNVPASYAAAPMAQAGGVGPALARADSTEQAVQRLISAASGTGSASNALAHLRATNPEAYQQLLYEEAFARARGQTEGRNITGNVFEQLLNMQAGQ